MNNTNRATRLWEARIVCPSDVLADCLSDTEVEAAHPRCKSGIPARPCIRAAGVMLGATQTLAMDRFWDGAVSKDSHKFSFISTARQFL